MAEVIERRAISYRRLFTRHFIWVPFVPLFMALIFGSVALHLSRTAELLEVYGVEAVATVIDRDIRRTRDSDGHTRTEYRLTYRFQPASGPAVTTRASVSAATYGALPPGSETPVRYVGHDPAVNEIEPGNAALTGWIFMLFAVLFGAVGLGLTIWIGRRKASLLRAALYGEVRQARVTGRDVTNTRINGRSQYRLTWQDAAGSQGRSGLFALPDLPAEGTVIVVYVDGRTGRGWWEEEL
ncbi:MAG: DUF3592 domain-containing protein [Pararhodobacter sp.]|nr:DUF3592 domain-containing protein [Pararhodobacter sp.]